MDERPPALDAPGSTSRSQKRVVVALIVLATACVAPIYLFADRQLPVVPGVLLSYLGCTALIQFVVAILLFGHAVASGVRSFLLLAAASEFAMLMAPAWMLAAPGALSMGDLPILGNSSSSTYVWLSIVLAFTLASALFPIVHSREAGSSAPGVGWRTVTLTSLAMLAAATTWSVVTLWGPDRLPTLLLGVAPQYQPTPVLRCDVVRRYELNTAEFEVVLREKVSPDRPHAHAR